ncbi:hypothetical protein BLJAPNOD_01024 [Ensifer sp. M14]|uniref:hypothetical protein n=1 Tax=Ensifer sp. M14 TaxID=2203782 RepID=UPI000E1D7280|nr:hypothetical protein [Ensifer sp. M14]RDL49910.1 hypothetical protein BLJAPNOD_01024 [Ensifer sp. M14]
MDKSSRAVEDLQGLAAVTRRFPSRSLEIRRLLLRDESFRGICADLAAVEDALACVDRLPLHLRDERRAEFEGMIESLASEIEQSLR